MPLTYQCFAIPEPHVVPLYQPPRRSILISPLELFDYFLLFIPQYARLTSWHRIATLVNERIRGRASERGWHDAS